MDKPDIIAALKEMGDLLEIAEGNPFQINAYRRAARSLEDWQGDLEQCVAEQSLSSIDGVGKGIGTVITELVRDGRSTERDEIAARVPEGLPSLLRLSGIGPKKVKALWRELGIEDRDALEAAARDGRVRALRGFGAKTEERILRSIERLRQAPSTKVPRTDPPDSGATAERVRHAPPSAGRLLVGTSGYAYKEWRGSFYPDDLSEREFLRYYAERLSTVEINNSFYRFPSESALRGWAEQASPDFRFTVKANQRITHRSRLKNVAEVTASFAERCGILGEQLGCILYQLPPDLQADRDRLAAFLACLPAGGRHAIEFRHASWFEEPVLDLLREHHVALVVADADGLECPRLATSSFVYLRLRRDAYDAALLDSWAAWIGEQTAAGRDVFAYLKHDEAGTSPAAVLDRLLQGSAAPARRAARSAGGRKRSRPADAG